MKRKCQRWAVNVPLASIGNCWLVKGWPFFSREIQQARPFTKKNALRLASTLGGSAHIIPEPMTPEEVEEARKLGKFLAERRDKAIAEEQRQRLN